MHKLRRTIHIYVPEDSATNSSSKGGVSCEVNYFKMLFKRDLSASGWELSLYTYKQKDEFKRKIRESKKRDFGDLFYVILDADLDGSKDKIIDSKAQYIHRPYREFNDISYSGKNKFKVNFILSYRSWEVWMCMHNCRYSSPFISQIQLNEDVDDDYIKSKDWYKSHRGKLRGLCTKAVIHCKSAREKIYERNSHECNSFSLDKNSKNNLDFSSKESISSFFKFCKDFNVQITYVDLIVCEILNKIESAA